MFHDIVFFSWFSGSEIKYRYNDLWCKVIRGHSRYPSCSKSSCIWPQAASFYCRDLNLSSPRNDSATLLFFSSTQLHLFLSLSLSIHFEKYYWYLKENANIANETWILSNPLVSRPDLHTTERMNLCAFHDNRATF